MSRMPLLIGLLLAGMILGGCATSPWTTGQNSAGGWVKPSFTKPTTAPTTSAKPNVQNPTVPPANNQANSQAMQEVMEELRQLGTLDPAAQNNLMEDLKQTDPALWPLVMQQFRAAVAYKRRAALSPLATANAAETSKVQKLPS